MVSLMAGMSNIFLSYGTHAVATTFRRLIERLGAPVRTAVIPAAGGQHRLLAQHVMQGLLLRSIREAAEAGIRHVILVLAPGTGEALYSPLKAALELAVVPAITFGRYLLQPSIFGPLRALKATEQRPVHLTAALEQLRRARHSVYAIELGAMRQDVGESLDEAHGLMSDVAQRL
jgi:UTP-glucose-1-phosphate uridylyltransferase